VKAPQQTAAWQNLITSCAGRAASKTP